MAKGWAGAVGLSLFIHVGLLAGFARPQLLAGPMARESMRVHLLPASERQAEQVSVHAAVSQQRRDAAPPESAATGTVPVQAPALLAPADRTLSSKPTAESATESGNSLAPAPDYLSANGLDSPPSALGNIAPEYPEAAGAIEGLVRLRLLISSSGDVDDVAVVSATPPGYFEASALAAFSKAKFSPGYFLGVPVKSQLLIEIGYTPINRGAAVSGQSH